jgi:acetyl esterase/lipase
MVSGVGETRHRAAAEVVGAAPPTGPAGSACLTGKAGTAHSTGTAHPIGTTGKLGAVASFGHPPAGAVGQTLGPLFGGDGLSSTGTLGDAATIEDLPPVPHVFANPKQATTIAKRSAVPAAVLAALLSACSPVTVLNAVAPTRSLTITQDVPYGTRPRQRLDVYAPARRDAPVVVFLYGGGWVDGEKGQYRFLGASLAARGYLTVVPDYRVYPEVRFPGFVQDGAAAVAWTYANIARYGGDPSRIVLMGHSAGAQIAALLTLDRQWLRADGLDPDHTIAGMIGLAGPYDFLPLNDPELETIFAPAGDLRLTQPITFARGDAPPMFLASGASDDTVWPRNTLHLTAAMQAQGGAVEMKLYRGASHRLIVGAMAGPLRWTVPVLRDVTRFLDQITGGRAAKPEHS